jgi:hypothetical protein
MAHGPGDEHIVLRTHWLQAYLGSWEAFGPAVLGQKNVIRQVHDCCFSDGVLHESLKSDKR